MRTRILLIVAVLILTPTAAYLWHATNGLGARDASGSVEAWAARNIRAWSVPRNYKKLRNPIGCTTLNLAEARAHWADHCAMCHSNNGSGDAFLAQHMYPHPPDMRLPVTQNQSDGELYYVIKNGIRLTGMPAFGEPGDHDPDSWELVCFVRHLPKMSADEELEMRTLNPKTPADLEEERQEQEFLNGGEAPAPAHQHPVTK